MALRKPRSEEVNPSDIQKMLDAPRQDCWHTYRCKLVTPMYGGGVKAGTVDRQMPVRAASIRGQLRFWWRIACGPFESARTMFERETAIWGGIGGKGPTASKVRIRVTSARVSDAHVVPSSSAEHGSAVKYAFGAAANNGDANWLRPEFEFKLDIRFPSDVANEVEMALRWWATFGGIGARTRRGFGAVHIDSFNLGFIDDAAIARAGCLVTRRPPAKSPVDAWKDSVQKLQMFRQGRGFARAQGDQRPGRSFWPEPDQLRRDTNMNDNGRHMPEHLAGNVFPRAAFGLPIIFDFHKTSEPNKSLTELLPDGDKERMASPLILRPCFVNGTWQATALLLPTWKSALSQMLRYKNLKSKVPRPWPGDPILRTNSGKHIRPKEVGKAGPMVKADGSLRASDPLSAFMQFFTENK